VQNQEDIQDPSVKEFKEENEKELREKKK